MLFEACKCLVFFFVIILGFNIVMVEWMPKIKCYTKIEITYSYNS